MGNSYEYNYHYETNKENLCITNRSIKDTNSKRQLIIKNVLNIGNRTNKKTTRHTLIMKQKILKKTNMAEYFLIKNIQQTIAND